MLKRIAVGPVLVVFSAGLWAQDPAGAPARVARLSYAEGQVGLQSVGSPDWTEARLNYPLSNGDRLWTDNGQAEVRVDAAAVHLAPQTAFSIGYLDEHVFQMSCSEGAMNVRILRANEGDVFEIDTPNGAISLLGPGSYRIDVGPAGDYTTVAVRAGAAEATAAGQSFRADAGQVLRLSGTDGIADLLALNAPDAWDEWCQARDDTFERNLEAAAQYVSWQVVGAEDLSQYGDWQIDVMYGPCWTPHNVPWGWNPYAHGRWIHRWGWTWDDDARWGFAPFHYGRWVHHHGLWRWVPGPRSNRPYFSPALVAFVNPRHDGRIAWVPLGPGEAIGQKTAYLNREHVVDVRHEEFGAAPNSGRVVQPPRRVFDRAVMTRHRLPVGVEARGGTSAIAPSARGRQPDGAVQGPIAPGRRVDQNQRRVDEQQAIETTRIEEQRHRDEQRQAEDRRRQQEQDRAVQQQRRADEQRRADAQRRAEEQSRAQEQRRADERRQADQQRRTEEQRSFRQERQQQEQRRVEPQPRWQAPVRVEPARPAEAPAKQESKSNDSGDRRGRR